MAIAAQERLRGVIDDELVDLAVASLRDRLDALDGGDRRRRQGTALIADVRGFTALSESLDAEIVSEVMDEIWSLVDAILTVNGARIDKHMGDAVLAVWGASAAQEDDPERAVRSALELQAALEQYRATSGRDVAMRVGVSTGPMVFGEVTTTKEFTVMGDAVNLASRLEHVAPTHGVLISHDTYRHVRGTFDVTPQAPLSVKGKAEPVRTYVVLRPKEQAFRMPTRGRRGGRDAARSDVTVNWRRSWLRSRRRRRVEVLRS